MDLLFALLPAFSRLLDRFFVAELLEVLERLSNGKKKSHHP
jgi:hypothetical protein